MLLEEVRPVTWSVLCLEEFDSTAAGDSGEFDVGRVTLGVATEMFTGLSISTRSADEEASLPSLESFGIADRFPSQKPAPPAAAPINRQRSNVPHNGKRHPIFTGGRGPEAEAA